MTASFGNLILDKKKKFLHSTETFEIRIPKFGQTLMENMQIIDQCFDQAIFPSIEFSIN